MSYEARCGLPVPLPPVAARLPPESCPSAPRPTTSTSLAEASFVWWYTAAFFISEPPRPLVSRSVPRRGHALHAVRTLFALPRRRMAQLDAGTGRGQPPTEEVPNDEEARHLSGRCRRAARQRG